MLMRVVAARGEQPELFTWEDYSGLEYLDRLTSDQIAENEFAKAEAVWPGVAALIRDDYTWNDGFIVEGDDILPRLVARDFAESDEVKAVFLGDHDAERVRAVVAARHGSAGAPADKEVEWILAFGERVKAEAAAHQMPWVDVSKDEGDLDKVLAALGLD